MSGKGILNLIGGALGPAIGSGVVWYVVNGIWQVNGQGLLERAPWPLSEVWICVAAGAVAGALFASVQLERLRRLGIELRALSERLGFEFQAELTDGEWNSWSPLPRFKNTLDATNRVTGSVSGVSFEMLDHERRIENGDSHSRRAETIVLFRAMEPVLPSFELQPRTVGLTLLAAAGIGEIRFAAAADDDPSARLFEDFHDAFHLSPGEAAQRAALADDTGPAEAAEAGLRRVFSRDLLRFFVAHSDWHVQSQDGMLALWRPKTIVSAAERPAFLAEALAIREAILATAAASGDVACLNDVVISSSVDASQLGVATAVGFALGFMVGGVCAGAAAMTVFFQLLKSGHDNFQVASLASMATFFGGTIAAGVLGAVLGRKLVGPILMRRAQAKRLVREGNESVSELVPPEGSSITAESQGATVVIELRPIGVLRAGGAFLFIWSLLWNLFLVVATPLFLTAAFRGEMKNEAGVVQSPWLVCLFLVPFWAIGAGSAAFLANRGRRRSTVTASDRRLRITTTSLFQRREDEWPVEDMESIVATGVETGRPRLLVHTRSGGPHEYFGERTAAERRWLVRLLNKTLLNRSSDSNDAA